MRRVAVIGGGAAGMMAAIAAARAGHSVTVLEKNEKLGKKLFLTGKGRCNLTNACETEELFQNIVTNHKFLYSSVYGFDNHAAMQFFEELGLKLKTERGNRVFPASDHSSDVIRVLERELQKRKVDVKLRTEVKGISIADGHVNGVRLENDCLLPADAVIVATGGYSYPSTGSTGDGYRFAEEAGHTVIPCYPSLVPMETEERWCQELMGLTLKNISLSLHHQKQELFRGFGELLFTHFGVSGPLILSASAYIGSLSPAKLQLFIDLKPALSEEQLDKRVQRDFLRYQNRRLGHAFDDLLPKRLIPYVLQAGMLSPEKQVNTITVVERRRLLSVLKRFPLHIRKLRGYSEAIITRGGISVKEIQPQTMESKRVKGLYFAGEILDTDALTGGFNLQIAWSTGYAAGCGIE